MVARRRERRVNLALHPGGSHPACANMLGDMAALRATALKRPSRDGVARVSDVALDFGVLAFAAWTLIYHACLYLHIRSVWAAVAEALLLIPCALVAGRRTERPDAEPATAALRPRSATPRRIALAVNVLAALAAAIVFGWVKGNWSIIWPLWLISAIAGFALTYLPRAGGPRPSRAAGAARSPRSPGGSGWRCSRCSSSGPTPTTPSTSTCRPGSPSTAPSRCATRCSPTRSSPRCSTRRSPRGRRCSARSPAGSRSRCPTSSTSSSCRSRASSRCSRSGGCCAPGGSRWSASRSASRSCSCSTTRAGTGCPARTSSGATGRARCSSSRSSCRWSSCCCRTRSSARRAAGCCCSARSGSPASA